MQITPQTRHFSIAETGRRWCLEDGDEAFYTASIPRRARAARDAGPSASKFKAFQTTLGEFLVALAAVWGLDCAQGHSAYLVTAILKFLVVDTKLMLTTSLGDIQRYAQKKDRGKNSAFKKGDTGCWICDHSSSRQNPDSTTQHFHSDKAPLGQLERPWAEYHTLSVVPWLSGQIDDPLSPREKVSLHGRNPHKNKTSLNNYAHCGSVLTKSYLGKQL